jgi:hypothetical protein
MVVGSNLYFLGVSGGVVHGRGFESLTFVGQWWRVHGRGRATGELNTFTALKKIFKKKFCSMLI